ncbi:MAG: hypothetical protein ACI8WB_004872, partial [Phenylobacterium sp.]
QEDGCIVFHCDMSQYMNLTTVVEVTDFLISVMAALNDAVLEKYGKDFSQRGFTQRLGDFLTQEVKVEDASFKANIATLKLSLKNDPDFKRQLQQSLKGRANQIVKQANDFAQEVVTFIRQKSNDADLKVVLLVDSVEQIRGVGNEAQAVYQSVENLFSAHAENLQIPMIHILYTIPPYTSALAPGVARTLGGNPVQTLPSIHVRTRDGSDDPQGLQIMFDIVKKRCNEVESFLTIEQVHDLARFSGGDLRNFFRFIRQCLVKAMSSFGFPLPLDNRLLIKAINQFRREMMIAHDDLKWLRLIDESSDHQLTSQEALAQFARFLDGGLVLNYRNGEDWYGVNPLLREQLLKAPMPEPEPKQQTAD